MVSGLRWSIPALMTATSETAADIGEKIYYNFPNTTDTDFVRAGAAGSSGVDTFEVKIGIVANESETEDMESVSNHALKIVLDPDGTPDPDPLNNLMRDKKIAPVAAGFGATRVGDGVLFGLDAERPIHGSVFQSIVLDLGRLNTVTTDTADVTATDSRRTSLERSRLSQTRYSKRC